MTLIKIRMMENRTFHQHTKNWFKTRILWKILKLMIHQNLRAMKPRILNISLNKNSKMIKIRIQIRTKNRKMMITLFLNLATNHHNLNKTREIANSINLKVKEFSFLNRTRLKESKMPTLMRLVIIEPKARRMFNSKMMELKICTVSLKRVN